MSLLAGAQLVGRFAVALVGRWALVPLALAAGLVAAAVVALRRRRGRAQE